MQDMKKELAKAAQSSDPMAFTVALCKSQAREAALKTAERVSKGMKCKT